MRIYQYIDGNLEFILSQWEIKVRALAPPAWKLTSLALRDHAPQLLKSIAHDIKKPAPSASLVATVNYPSAQTTNAAKSHGEARHHDGFDAAQVGAEYNALRAITVHFWRLELAQFDQDAFDDLDRFDTAINKALTVSLGEYSAHLVESKDTFVAILGHDLRSPLAAISMGAEFLLAHSPLNPTQRPIIQTIMNSTARMAAMIKDLLAYSSKQLGNAMPITVRATDIRAVCEAAINEAMLAYPNSQFVLDISGALNGMFDGGRVQQLLSNLLANAVQYGENKTPVMISAHNHSPDEIVIQVKNAGPVIPPQALERIFEPLVRYTAEHPGEKDAYLSTSLGLGLYIARTIAEAHGGTIKASSSMMDGTVFTLRLPMHKSAGAS